MIHVKLDDRYAKRWFAHGPWRVAGHARLGGRFVEAEAFAELASSQAFESRWPDVLCGLSGFYSIVRCRDGALWAAVDPARSMPLFYGASGTEFLLSDDANWVRQRVDDRAMDELARVEFLLSRSVSGRDTLYPKVKQLLAGQCLAVADAPGGPCVQTRSYYEYRHHDPWEEGEASLLDRTDAAMAEAGRRLVESARGRTLVVPLSGGYDSRAIALMLRRQGYENVLCFSYGRPGNRESEVSRAVADRLGFPWVFVPYTNQRWSEWFGSEQRKRYYEYAHGVCSLPHLQDWPAVWELHEQGRLPEGSLFVPGHTALGACGAAGALAREGRCSPADVLGTIRQAVYCWQDPRDFDRGTWSRIERRILSGIEPARVETPEQAVDALEHWQWRNEQTKYICNAVRAYEQWGYGWRMPLYDLEVMAFWQRVPAAWRVGKALFNAYVVRCGGQFGLPEKPDRPSSHKRRLRGVLSVLGLERLAWRVMNRRRYLGHPLAFNGLVPEKAYRRLASQPRPYMTYLTRECLGMA